MTQAPARSVLPAPSVLVVEDDDNIAAVLEYILLREGLTHQRVATGATALAVMQALRPDLVLLDVMLPEVSGYDLCQSARRDPALNAMRIVMMTASGSANQRSLSLQAGADGFISKPFELETLRIEIRRHLHQTP